MGEESIWSHFDRRLRARRRLEDDNTNHGASRLVPSLHPSNLDVRLYQVCRTVACAWSSQQHDTDRTWCFCHTELKLWWHVQSILCVTPTVYKAADDAVLNTCWHWQCLQTFHSGAGMICLPTKHHSCSSLLTGRPAVMSTVIVNYASVCDVSAQQQTPTSTEHGTVAPYLCPSVDSLQTRLLLS